jgi:hypothetical protein
MLEIVIHLEDDNLTRILGEPVSNLDQRISRQPTCRESRNRAPLQSLPVAKPQLASVKAHVQLQRTDTNLELVGQR